MADLRVGIGQALPRDGESRGDLTIRRTPASCGRAQTQKVRREARAAQPIGVRGVLGLGGGALVLGESFASRSESGTDLGSPGLGGRLLDAEGLDVLPTAGSPVMI